MANYTVPAMPVPISIWRYSSWLGVVPPVVLPDYVDVANLTPGRRIWDGLDSAASYLLVLTTCDIRFSEHGTSLPIVTTDPDLVEVPTGSARFYQVLDVEYLGLMFANEHKCALIAKVLPFPTGGPTPPPPTGSLLLEDLTSYLLEAGGDILLE